MRSLAVYAARDGNFSFGTSCEDSLGFLHLLRRARRFHRFGQILDHDFLFPGDVAIQSLLHLRRGYRLQLRQVGIHAAGVTVNHGRFAKVARLAIVSFPLQQLPSKETIFCLFQLRLGHAFPQNLRNIFAQRFLSLSDGFSARQNESASKQPELFVKLGTEARLLGDLLPIDE